MTRLAVVRDTLARLVAFDTTSRNSNLALIDWVEDTLRPHATALRRLPNAAGDKANLWARFGPDAPGGLVLSGHTDVVPIDGQPWSSDPWTLTERDGRLYGRGTSDMKGFLALCMAHAPEIAARARTRPVHFAFSFDEEIGCAGVVPMVDALAREGAAPDAVWVGEPTSWGVYTGHKGICDYEVRITGKAAHSSDPRRGASAIHEAIELMNVLRAIARAAEQSAPSDSPFDPPWTTLTIGMIRGGTAHNIIARECVFGFDLRMASGGQGADDLLAPFWTAVAHTHEKLSALEPECGVEIHKNAEAPPLVPTRDNPAERLMRELTGDNATRVAAYATEAGQFQARGLPSVICGPGSIEQAHQPDEFLAISELERGIDVFARLLQRLS